jgi:outer membrane protein OmpA-like peptidoglycan-associated protein
MTRSLHFVACAAILVLGACATDPVTGQAIYGRTATGAVIGALGGAAAGTLAGGKDGRNAMVGAAVGALAGAGIGRYMDQQEADMRKAVANTGIGIERVGDNIELVMPSDVTFAKDSSSIDAQFTPVLTQVAKSLNLYPKTTIDIIGHASTDGDANHNMELSRQRADSVRVFLQGSGVLPARMVSTGMGETQPLVLPERTEADRKKNRRVQIELRPVTQG